MFGIYLYWEFKDLVKIENKRISCEIAVPVIKLKNKIKGIIIDFQYDNEYVIFRDSIQFLIAPTTMQINAAVTKLYKNFCDHVLNQGETDENRHTEIQNRGNNNLY